MPNLSFSFENRVCYLTLTFWMSNHFADSVEFCSLLPWYNAHLYGYDLCLCMPKRTLWQVGFPCYFETPLNTHLAEFLKHQSLYEQLLLFIFSSRIGLAGGLVQQQHNTVIFLHIVLILHSSGPFTSFVCSCRLWELCISCSHALWLSAFKGVCIILWVILCLRQLQSGFGFGGLLG